MIKLKDARKQFAAIGYKLKTTRYSNFIGVDIIHKETGYRLGSIISKDDYDFFKPAIKLREELKGDIFEDESKNWRVVI